MRVVILSFWKGQMARGGREESRTSRFQERERLRNKKSFLLLPNFVKELRFFKDIQIVICYHILTVWCCTAKRYRV